MDLDTIYLVAGLVLLPHDKADIVFSRFQLLIACKTLL
jgi:hypothetical protein